MAAILCNATGSSGTLRRRSSSFGRALSAGIAALMARISRAAPASRLPAKSLGDLTARSRASWAACCPRPGYNGNDLLISIPRGGVILYLLVNDSLLEQRRKVVSSCQEGIKPLQCVLVTT